MPHLDPSRSLDSLQPVVAADLDTEAEITDTWLVGFDADQLIRINLSVFRDIINALVAITGVTPVTATTAELEDVGDAINTANKAAGKMVWNTTTGVACFADGALAADTWSEADGTLEHTPV